LTDQDFFLPPRGDGTSGPILPLPQLPKQLDCAVILPSGKRSHSTGSVDRHCAQKLGKLAWCARVEAAISAVSQARNLAKYTLNFSIAALLEHEGGHAQTSELAPASP
jgi:hypothetical protein